MKVSILSTHPPTRCGIATYTTYLEEGLKRFADVFVVPIEDPFSTSSRYYRGLALEMARADVTHIQHEYTLFGKRYSGRPYIPMVTEILGSINYVPLIYQTLKSSGVKVVTTLHEASRDRQLHNLKTRVFRDKDDARPLNLPGRIASTICEKIICSFVDSQLNCIISHSDKIIVHTHNAKRILIENRTPEEKVATIPHGTYQKPKFLDREECKERLGLKGKKVLCIFGFIRRYKGYDDVIPLLPKLKEDIILLIAGGARIKEHESYVNELKERARDLGVGDRIIITGYINENDLSIAFNATDVMLFPYHGIEQSGSLCVALAHNVPTIASNIPGFREIQEEFGCLEIFRDRDELLQKIVNLIDDVGRQDELRRRSKTFWEATNWGEVARKTFQVYKEVMS